MEETVKISDLSIHKVGRHVGVDIDKMSFKLTSKDTQNLCSAKNIAFPVPHDILPCGESKYSFALWPGQHGAQFRVMIHHDVGDSHVDLRGGADIKTFCDNSDEAGPGDETCTQVEVATFKIISPDM
ncbi:hypothetical protein BKA60DRAFT_600033 [Fusarium oxysporum]|nr:hypothetical protein BKA60DRAFT_600033 [Fusarium oxysporum]